MGRIPYLETPQNALQLIRPRHREIMRRLCTGQTQREIAREMDLDEGRLSIICNSPLFKSELRKMEKDIRDRVIKNVGDVTERVHKLQDPALDVLEGLLKGDKVPPHVKRHAAMDILSLAGTGSQDKNQEGMSDFAQFITDSFEEAKARAFDKLNRAWEAESQSRSPKLVGSGNGDMSGEALPLDQAEDLALASFSLEQSTFNSVNANGQLEAAQDQAANSITLTNEGAVLETSPSFSSPPTMDCVKEKESGGLETAPSDSNSNEDLKKLFENILNKEGLRGILKIKEML